MALKSKRMKRGRTRNHRTRKHTKYLYARGGKSLNRKKKGKTVNLIDIGLTRTRITGQPGMNQNLEVSRKLAQSMK